VPSGDEVDEVLVREPLARVAIQERRAAELELPLGFNAEEDHGSEKRVGYPHECFPLTLHP
jgi:hypothetical protein